jgi:hypothetical protein
LPIKVFLNTPFSEFLITLLDPEKISLPILNTFLMKPLFASELAVYSTSLFKAFILPSAIDLTIFLAIFLYALNSGNTHSPIPVLSNLASAAA